MMKIKKRLAIVTIAVMSLLFTGCVQEYANLGTLDLKTKNYPNPEEISKLSFALARPTFKVNASLSNTLNTALKERVKYNSENIACHLTNEIHKIILSKGFTITQTFNSYNEMTFTEKRNTSALFFPEISIDVEEKSMTLYQGQIPLQTSGDFVVNAHVNIVMLEPLSGEKIWVKSIPVDELTTNIKYKPSVQQRAGGFGGQSMQSSGKHSVPLQLKTIADQLDAFFLKINDDVLATANKYVEQNEFEFLNDDIKRLKGIKRY